MGLYMKQTESRSELQEKLARELQDRAKKKALEADLADGVDDSQYLKGTKKTTSLAWAWALIFLASIGILIWLIIISR